MLAGCSRSPEARVAAAKESVPTIAVATAKRMDLEQHLTLTAELVPYEEIDVMAKVSGYVKQIYVDAGTRVGQGQLLAELEVPEMRADIARSGAEIQRRTAELERAKDDLRRAQSSYNFTHLS